MGAVLQWAVLLMQIIPAIPNFIATVENIFEASPTGAAKTGAQKLQAVMNMLGQAFPALASFLASQPSNVSIMEEIISGIVAVMNSVGSMTNSPATSAATVGANIGGPNAAAKT